MNIPLNIDWQQILLHVLNFVILFGGLYFLLYKAAALQAGQELHGKARSALCRNGTEGPK